MVYPWRKTLWLLTPAWEGVCWALSSSAIHHKSAKKRLSSSKYIMRLWLHVVEGGGSNKKKGETYLFLESIRAKCGYGLSFDDRTLHPEPQEGVGWA